MSTEDYLNDLSPEQSEADFPTEKKYPVSEIFTSPQGEGVYTGTLMTFIRLAGCSVGKPFPKERYAAAKGLCANCSNIASAHDDATFRRTVCNKYTSYTDLGSLPIYTEMCTLYDGRTFECDTDYRVKERLTPTEIYARVPENVHRVCITGGEPLIHDLRPLVRGRADHVSFVHLETSGSKELPEWLLTDRDDGEVWITISPKYGVLDQALLHADELKFLVDENFNYAEADKLIDKTMEWSDEVAVYIQPVNGEHEINFENLRRCLELQKQHPRLRISTQMHKIWKVR